MAVTLKDVIKEAIEFLGGEGTIEQVKNSIASNYGSRWKDVGGAMADLTFPGTKSSPYPKKERFLERIGRGRYRLRVQAAISREIILLWRRRTVSDLRGELLGVFNNENLAFEKIRGEKAIEYHVESLPLNKFNPSDSEIFFHLGKTKNGIVR